MNFFGIGPMELVVILILALIIFGPGKLPEIGRAVGKSIRDFRAMSDEFTGQFSLDLEEATAPKKKQAPEAKAPEQPTSGPDPDQEPTTEAIESSAETVEEQETGQIVPPPPVAEPEAASEVEEAGEQAAATSADGAETDVDMPAAETDAGEQT